jgi:hypothetical protein
VYVTAEAPDASATGWARVRAALGVAVGDRVRLAPAGLEPVDGVVDLATHASLGVRTPDALHRFCGRGPAHHGFAPGADADALGAAWQAWLDDVLATEPTEPTVAGVA